jgi:hypothetical protein
MKENAKNSGKCWHQFGTKGQADVSISCPTMQRMGDIRGGPPGTGGGPIGEWRCLTEQIQKKANHRSVLSTNDRSFRSFSGSSYEWSPKRVSSSSTRQR